MVSVFAASAVACGFEPRSGKTKDLKIGICCFSAKHAALRSKNEDWLARNQNNVSDNIFGSFGGTVSAGRRHTNGYELCPSSSRFIFILI